MGLWKAGAQETSRQRSSRSPQRAELLLWPWAGKRVMGDGGVGAVWTGPREGDKPGVDPSGPSYTGALG